MDDLCKSIASIISNYRDNEFGVYDYNHVFRWISQFQDHEKQLVLEETNKILKRNFITRKSFEKLIDTLIDFQGVYLEDKEKFWRSVSALNIQKNGSSQNELNQIFCGKVAAKFGVNDLVGKISDQYIYLDDFIFTGNRLYQDLEHWILNFAPQKCRVSIITLGWYIYGQYNTYKRLCELVRRTGKDIKFEFFSYTEYRLENRLVNKDSSEVFWPDASIQNEIDIINFVQRENFTPRYRDNNYTNNVFSIARRNEYEKIILKYGIKIMSYSEKNNFVVKPLGYSTYRGFGFGSTMFSFRNCPNNNPLVFWWGDPKANRSHPFSRWYPLLQRKTYVS